MTTYGTYAVVENAGYVGECDIRTGLLTYMEASDYMHSYYDQDEIEGLHVDIALDMPDGHRTYEV
jgi:hypothetical protein